MTAAPPLPLAPRGFFAVSLLMIGVTDLLALTSLPPEHSPLPSIAGVVLFTAVGVVVALNRDDRLPRASTIVASATPTALVLVSSWGSAGDYGRWYLSAGAFLLLALALRGRLKEAWIGMAAMAATRVLWVLLNSGGLDSTLGNLARQAGILVVGTVFAVAIGRTRRRLEHVERDARTRAADLAAADAAAAERARRLDWAHDLAHDLLVAIADGDRLDGETRTAAALAEAELRDGLRARALSREPVTSAARAARRRGVEVVLLDDRGGDAGGRVAGLLERIAAELDATAAGRIVVRLLPAGRQQLATIVIDGPRPRRVELE